MYFLMQYHEVPRLARKKVGNSLVTLMIGEYIRTTTTTSSQRLASFIGRRMHRTDDKVDQAFERRTQEIYAEIFPDHHRCDKSCCGHRLPEMPFKFLKELNLPAHYWRALLKTVDEGAVMRIALRMEMRQAEIIALPPCVEGCVSS